MKISAQYNNLVNDVMDPVYICDEHGIIHFYNKAAIEFWGREIQLGNIHINSFIKPITTAEEKILYDNYPMAIILKNGLPLENVEIVIETPNGIFKNALQSSYPLHDNNGKIVGAVNMQFEK